MKKLPFILMVALLLISTAWAQTGNTYHEIQVVDERGENVTTITSVYIYAPDSTTDAVIYSDKGQLNTITIPMTTSSTNTTLVNGKFTWFGPDGYDFSITDGANIATNADHRTRTGSEGTLVFPSYLTAISSTTYSDAQSATFGDGGDWVLRGGNVANQMSFTPIADNSSFIIGVDGTSLNSDFTVFVGTSLGLKLDAGDPSLTWDGGAVLLNSNSNFNVGINTGTSTGITSIGSATAGGFAVDTTAGITVNADDSYALTVSAGTIGAAATGGDITIDATDKSVIIRGTEEAADAILLDADGTAGGIELQCGTGDITLDSGDDIFLEANTGTGDVISAINTKGTSTSSMILQSVVGGINVDAELEIAINVAAAASNLVLGSTLGSVYITAEEDAANALYLLADGSTATTLKIHNDTGTSATDAAASVQITSDVGGIEILSGLAAANQIRLNASGTVAGNAVVLETTNGGIQLNADGGDNGDITLDSADDLIFTSAGKVTITNTEAVTVSGDLTVAGATTTVSYVIIDQVVTDTASVTLTAAMSGKILTIADLTQDTTIDLPAEADGLNFEFWYVGGATETHDHIIDAEANANFYIGGLQFIDSDDNSITEVYSNGSTNSKLTLSNMECGTIIKITCDGTNWYIWGVVYSDTAPAFAVSV